jgi:predicted nucleic acid-binding protein
VRSYLDSGVFVDYFVHQGVLASSFRSAPRRGRSPQQLGHDATICLEALASRHTAMTSVFTPYEMEEAAYRALRPTARGMARRNQTIIPTTREVGLQTMNTAEVFSIRLLELTPQIIAAVCREDGLQHRGIRAADAIHVITALQAQADLLVTADRSMLALDHLFPTLRCVDTDEALRLLA